MLGMAGAFAYNRPMGRLIRLPLRLMPRQAVVPILSGCARGAHWVVGSSIHGCWLGLYERDLQKRLAAALRPGCLFYDIGANVGFYTILAGRRGCKVIAVEPDPSNLERLQEHVRLNHLSDKVSIIPKAVAALAGEARFTPAQSMGRIDASGTVTVQTIRLDSLEAPDVIKMDIEGAEYEVIEASAGWLEQHRPTLFVATHRGPERIVDTLRNCGYRVHVENDLVWAE